MFHERRIGDGGIKTCSTKGICESVIQKVILIILLSSLEYFYIGVPSMFKLEFAATHADLKGDK